MIAFWTFVKNERFKISHIPRIDIWYTAHRCVLQVSFPVDLLLCPNVSTTPITAMGCWQSLPLSVVQLKGKHCRKPHCRIWGCRYVRAWFWMPNHKLQSCVVFSEDELLWHHVLDETPVRDAASWWTTIIPDVEKAQWSTNISIMHYLRLGTKKEQHPSLLIDLKSKGHLHRYKLHHFF